MWSPGSLHFPTVLSNHTLICFHVLYSCASERFSVCLCDSPSHSNAVSVDILPVFSPYLQSLAAGVRFLSSVCHQSQPLANLASCSLQDCISLSSPVLDTCPKFSERSNMPGVFLCLFTIPSNFGGKTVCSQSFLVCPWSQFYIKVFFIAQIVLLFLPPCSCKHLRNVCVKDLVGNTGSLDGIPNIIRHYDISYFKNSEMFKLLTSISSSSFIPGMPHWLVMFRYLIGIKAWFLHII